MEMLSVTAFSRSWILWTRLSTADWIWVLGTFGKLSKSRSTSMCARGGKWSEGELNGRNERVVAPTHNLRVRTWARVILPTRLGSKEARKFSLVTSDMV